VHNISVYSSILLTVRTHTHTHGLWHTDVWHHCLISTHCSLPNSRGTRSMQGLCFSKSFCFYNPKIFKGIILPKVKVLLLFTHPHVVLWNINVKIWRIIFVRLFWDVGVAIKNECTHAVDCKKGVGFKQTNWLENPACITREKSVVSSDDPVLIKNYEVKNIYSIFSFLGELTL